MTLGEQASRPPSEVTLDNWQVAPWLQWSFQHFEELFATATISRGPGPVAPSTDATVSFDDVPVRLLDGTGVSVGHVMSSTETDGWLVLRDGVVLTERYHHGLRRPGRHLLMSVSKSIVGIVAGTLVARGHLTTEATVETYVPARGDSGFAGATVRHLLDMRSGIRFSENYADPRAEVRLLEQAIGLARREHPLVARTMYDFLIGLSAKSAHGGAFEYRSGETDALGWVCEAAAGVRLPELISSVLWSRLGAEEDAVIAVDSVGAGMSDGGICVTLRDLAAFGWLLASGGVSPTGEQVVPDWWIEDTARGAPDSREAFAVSPTITLMPGGMYRNQLWSPYPDRDVLLGLGIHGQMVYVDRRTRLVAVKLSSWPEPQHAWKLFSTLRAFDAISDLYR